MKPEPINIFIQTTGKNHMPAALDCYVHVTGGLDHALNCWPLLLDYEEGGKADIDKELEEMFTQGAQLIKAEPQSDGTIKLTFMNLTQVKIQAKWIAETILNHNDDVSNNTNVDVYVNDSKKSYVYVEGRLQEKSKLEPPKPITIGIIDLMAAFILGSSKLVYSGRPSVVNPSNSVSNKPPIEITFDGRDTGSWSKSLLKGMFSDDNRWGTLIAKLLIRHWLKQRRRPEKVQ